MEVAQHYKLVTLITLITLLLSLLPPPTFTAFMAETLHIYNGIYACVNCYMFRARASDMAIWLYGIWREKVGVYG